jgi:Co/Zn/Cd efflux system component
VADARRSGTRAAVVVALAGNLLVCATKAVAAALTGSAAMLSEAVHSFVDTGNEALRLYGMRRAKKRADPDHPVSSSWSRTSSTGSPPSTRRSSRSSSSPRARSSS